MDQIAIAKTAEKLKEILLFHAKIDTNVRDLYVTLSALISDACSGRILVPVEWSSVPGAYYFNEKDLRKYDDLETAYAEFKIEVTGGESPLLKSLRANKFNKL